MKNQHIILVRHFMGADCIPYAQIKSELFKQTIKVPYTNRPDEIVSPLDEAKKHLEGKGFVITGKGELNNWYVLTSDTFKPLK